MKKIIIGIVALLALAGGTFYACNSNGTNHGVKALEEMSDVEFGRWKLYIELSTRVGAHRLLQEKVVTKDDLAKIATVVDGVTNSPIEAGATALIMPALQKAGFTNDEVTLVLMIAEQELLSRGALKWIDPTTGLVSLSPRTKEVLSLVSSTLRTVDVPANQ